MNAFELQHAAFAVEDAEETVEYLQKYASYHGIPCRKAVATQIIEARAAAKKATAENGDGKNNWRLFVELPLSLVELETF
jgi:hypothetical protein